MELIVGAPQRLADEFARIIAARARQAHASGRRFSLAVPGGSVARAFLPELGKAGIEWERVDLFFADERVVPESDPESNAGLARLLLADTAASEARWHVYDFEAAGFDAEWAARSYRAELEEVAGSPPVLDVVLLGIGEDGHLASIFPGLDDESDEPVRFVSQAPKPPRERLTLALHTICRARLIVLAAFGNAKAEVVRDAVAGERKELPVVRALECARSSLLMVDDAAALLLPLSS